MDQCRECELAIYCFTDSSSWIFRTKQEMEEKREAIARCPIYEQVQKTRSGRKTVNASQTG